MNKVIPKDAAARARIVTALDRSLLVEAGAGSGKTHEMAARMASGIAAGTYAIEHMAAVTFTRKAAAELRGRFQLALEDELTRTGNDTAREDRLRSALSSLERFFAGTIHAFCARLLRERPVEAGVSPGFTELDETEEQLLLRQSWRDYRTQARAAGDPDLVALLDAGITPQHLDDAFRTVCTYEDVEFPAGAVERPDSKAAWAALEKFRTELQRLLPKSIDPGHKCETLRRADRFERAWRFAWRNRRNDGQLVEMLEGWQSQPKVVQKWWGSKVPAKHAEALHQRFRDDVVIPYLTAWRQFVYGRTVTVLVNARALARQERRRRNTLSFNDLLFITADLLRKNADVRRSLQQKYRWLFVDEFQDTDPVQAEIMFLLGGAEDAASAGSADWRTIPLRPGALFVVGDPKQSIYRFRRADIDIYNQVRERLAGPDGAGLVPLTTNFRSVPALCDWANTVFKGLFPATPTPQAPQFAPLDHHRSANPSRLALATLTTPATVEQRDLLADEAERIARYIRSEVHAGRRKYGDFLILTRKRKPLKPYARALEALQVPIEVSGAGAFGESQEVQGLALLLGALTDPQDAVALVGVLRGPLFGISDRDLFAFRQADGYFNLFSECADPSGAIVASALETLRRWYRWTRMLPAGASLDRILDDSGYLALAAASPDGVEAGDLLHAVDRVRTVVESGFTLADAADALADWSGLTEGEGRMEESAEVDSLSLQPGRPDVVRLMNLHKAKGLEADVVFLVAPLSGVKPRADVRIVRTGGTAARGYFQIIKDSDNAWVDKVLAQPAGWDQLATDELAYVGAEGNRLLYVAATRARDLLVVSRHESGAGRQPAWGELDQHLAGARELAVPATVPPPPAVTVDLSAQALARASSDSERLHGQALRPSWAAVSVTAEVKAFPRITAGPDDAAPDDPTRVVVAETPSRRADAGVAWGTLIHGLLEHAMRHRSATRADLHRLAMWLTMETPELRVVIDKALDTVQGVAGAEFWRTARASAEVHEEAPFAVREEQDGLPTVVNGVVDLAYRDGDGWRIVDYKTDLDADSAELRRRYVGQIEAYRAAWERAVESERVRVEIYGARSG